MSVYGALFSGVSGLNANSNALGMISDNITNMNTVGYKATKAQFSTLATEAASQTTYSPGGVQAKPQTLVDNQGLLEASESPTDLGISGSGFFVVSDSPEDGVASGDLQFTRAGSFSADDEGFLKNTAGLYLKGWPIDENGDIPTNLGDLNTLETINIQGLTGTAEATTDVKIRANLRSSQSVSSAVSGGTYDATDTNNNLASGNVAPDFERNVQVFDAQGGTHTITMGFLKDSTNNQWNVELYSDDVSTPDQPISSGTMAFNPDGSLDLANTDTALTDPISVNWTNGAQASNITFDFGSDGKTNGMTQFDSTSTLISSSVNGAVFGNVQGVDIGEEGVVTAQFDNGLIKDVFKLPLATFQNPNGLERRNGNAFIQSDQSGTFSLQQAGTGGAGKFAPSTLEASTVDLAEEFTDMITTQRAYSAATRIITTADEMLTELNRVKR